MNDNRIKLVITHPSQLSERWVNYYCLNELSKVFDVEFWDCSALAYPSFTVAHPLTPGYLRVIHTLQEFEDNMKRLPKDTVLITEVHHNSKTYPFHKIQGHYFPHFAYIWFYGNDIDRVFVEGNYTLKDRRISGIKGALYQSNILRNLIKWLFHHKDADYQESRMTNKCKDSYTDCYSMSCVGTSAHRVNHPDFEQYLKVKEESSRLIQEPYIVFVDDYYPYHPEAHICDGENEDAVAEAYHKTMNEFFDYVEKQYQCKVVIAAHPYANYLDYNPFNGREVYYGKTAPLIRDSQSVCIHCSNAFSYVALFDKPVAFITNEALDKSNIGSATHMYSEKFKMPIILTDGINSYPNPLFVKMDADLRKKYIMDYLGDIDLPQPNSVLIQKYLKEFHDQLVNTRLK